MTEIPSTAEDTDVGTKACPDCAEQVQPAAQVCRFCGYRFDLGVPGAAAIAVASEQAEQEKARERAAASPKSPAGAAVLSLVIGGLGQLYVGEVTRGLAYFAMIGISVVAGYATDTSGPGPIVASFAAVDAYRGAKHFNGVGRPRGVTAGVWVGLALIAIMASVAMANAPDEYESTGPAYELVPCATNPEAIGC